MKPRIAHVISSPRGIGGAERVVAALSGMSAARGWETSVLNPFAAEASSGDLGELFSGAAYQERMTTRLIDLPRARSWLYECILERRPDILHIHLFHALALVATLPASCAPVRVVTHHHGDIFQAQGRAFAEWVDRWSGRRMDRVVAVSGAVKGFLVDHYGYPDGKLTIIRNGWSGIPAEGVPKAEQPTVICVANFRREKAHDVLLHAFKGIRSRITDAQLLLVGQGPLESQLRSLAERSGLQDAVRFVAAVDDVWPWLASAHVFTLPSVVEPLGIAVMEAMASGLPVVASRAGGIPELVEDGVTGILVAPGDPDALQDALGGLLASSEQRATMGESARMSAGGMTMDHMLDQYQALYERLLAESSRAAGLNP